MVKVLAFGVLVGGLVVAGGAFADEQVVVKGPTTVATVFVKGRPARPNVSVAIGRVPLDATVRELRKPLVDRIAASADKPPF